MKGILFCLFFALMSFDIQANSINDVTFHGAIPNDGIDDTLAFNTAIKKSTGVVYVPAGEYNLSSRLNFNSHTQGLKGDGMGITSLIWNSGSGIYFKPPKGFDGVALLQGVSLITKASDSGNAFQYDGESYLSSGIIQPRTRAKIIVRDVEAYGHDGVNSDGWNYGLIIDNSLGAMISGYRFSGRNSGDSPMSDAGILMRGSGKPVEITISETSIYHAKSAISVYDHEGLFVENSNLVAVNEGVRMETRVASTKPQLNISDSHINCRASCIIANDINDISVKNNLFYLRKTAEKNGFGVKLTGNGVRFNISGNTFANTSPKYNFDLVYSSSDYGLISNNIFNNGNRGTAIWLGVGSSNVKGMGNLCYRCGSRVYNQGDATNSITFLN
jgi:hypothetical protein